MQRELVVMKAACGNLTKIFRVLIKAEKNKIEHHHDCLFDVVKKTDVEQTMGNCCCVRVECV